MKWLYSSAVLALIVSVLFVIVRQAAPSAVIDGGEIHETIVGNATVLAQDGIADVRARIDGKVIAVHVREGERVVAGQVLAELDPTELSNILSRATAERESLQAGASADRLEAEQALRLAIDEARKTRRLAESGAESKEAVRQANAALEIARAKAARARANVDLARGGAAKSTAAGNQTIDDAKRRLEWTRIVAPIGGVIVGRHVDEGDVVGSGANSFEIADPIKTEVAIEIEEEDSLRVKESLDVSLTLPGQREVIGRGRVVRTGAAVHRRTIGVADARLRGEVQVKTVWMTWDEKGSGGLPLGKRLEAAIHLPAKTVKARAPRAAIVISGGNAFLREKIGPFARIRTIRLGVADDAFVEVIGIDRGSRVFASALSGVSP